MNLQLLRRPGPGFPALVDSGIADVDAFLRDLDACLVGSARVRALHLAEVKDHVLQRRDHALDRGCTEDEATREALDMFGFAAEFGADQRAGLWRRFWYSAISAGVLFGLVLFCLELIGRPADAQRSWSALALQAVAYGAAMGWMIAFVWPPKVLPPADRTGGAFVVRRSLAWRVTSLLAAGGFGLLGLGCLVAIFVPSAPSYFGLSTVGLASLGMLSALNVRNCLMGAEAIAVDEHGLEIRMPWSSRVVPWSRVCAVERLGDRHRWIPGWNYWSRVRVLQYTAADGTRREAKIYPDVPNADRLTVLARSKLASS